MTGRAAIVCRLVTGLGGTTTTVLEHARRLVKAGWLVDVIAAKADYEEVVVTGAQLIRLPHLPWGGWAKRWLFARLAESRCGASRYDVVHGHGDEFAHDLLSLHNCVHATHEAVHGSPLSPADPTGRLHERILKGGKFRVLIANSELMKRDVCARWGVDAGKVEVIHPGLREEKFRVIDRDRLRGAARAELGFSDDDVVFALITSGDFVKRGVSRFLEAFGRLRGREPRAKALVVGKESRLGPYLALAKEGGFADAVRFMPGIPDVEKHFHASDVYVHPAAYEEFGQSVLEAMACGLPVITGEKVGAAELLPPSCRARLLRTLEPAELSQAMAALAADASLRERLGHEAALASRGRGWDENFRRTLSFYDRVLQSNPPGK